MSYPARAEGLVHRVIKGGGNHSDKEKTLKKTNHPYQLQTDNMSTYEMENTDRKDYKDLWLSSISLTISWRTERILLSYKRNRWPTIHRSVHTWRCPCCNGYRRRKWTRRHEFKSWTRLIAFHIALIPLGKVWIQLFSLQLWVNSRTD